MKGARQRKDRWELRGILKHCANRLGQLKAQHPQVRRLLVKAKHDLKDALRGT